MQNLQVKGWLLLNSRYTMKKRRSTVPAHPRSIYASDEMAVTNYITIDGMLMGEMTNGVMRNYGTDALGSVVETVLNGVEENTYQYKPYGGLLAKTGVAADPLYLWNGENGYRQTGLPSSEYYVRARHYDVSSAKWTTKDPEWPSEQPYTYAGDSPVLEADPTGLYVPTCCCKATGANSQPKPVFPGTPYPALSNNLPKNCRDSYSGWNALYRVNLQYTYQKNNNGTQCSAVGTENRYEGTSCDLSHLRLLGSYSWNSSRTYNDWTSCLAVSTPPNGCKNCSPSCSNSCKLHDDPGAVPCSKSRTLLSTPYAYAVAGAVQIKSKCSNTCIQINYTFCEVWNSLPGTASSKQASISVNAC